jgi:transcriptional regulator with XRE-family HTH domain
MRLVDQTLPVNLNKHVLLMTMNEGDKRTPEQVVGANIKAMRTQLGLTQAELAEAMQGLGHSWVQTTVAKTEAADRPLRVNEVADLARILGTRLPDLVSAHSDWNRKGINLMLSHFQGHAARLRMDIDELNQQLAAKTQAYDEAQERVRELQRDLASVDG